MDQTYEAKKESRSKIKHKILATSKGEIGKWRNTEISNQKAQCERIKWNVIRPKQSTNTSLSTKDKRRGCSKSQQECF